MMSGIWLLACPLGMFAMGGVAWAARRLPGQRAQRLRGVAQRATCMPGGSPKPTIEEDTSTTASSSHV